VRTNVEPRSRVAGRWWRGALALAALSQAHCTAAVNGIEDVCSTDADCDERGGAYTSSVCRRGLCVRPETRDPWACVGLVEYARPEAPSATVSFTIVDPIDRKPVGGMSIVPCSSFDATCMSPLGPPVVTDAAGSASLTVSTEATVTGLFGFSGYFRITGPNRNSFLAFTAPPIVRDHVISTLIGKPETLAVLSPSPAVPVDPKLGQGIVTVGDCFGARASGVRIELDGADGGTRVFYAVGVSPNEAATVTDTSGIAFLVNVPPGLVILHAFDAKTGREVARLNVVEQAGFVSLVDLGPTPL
jgi:hypothetical protein